MKMHMPLLPEHPVSRMAAGLWLLACLSFLAMTLLRPDLYAGERSALTLLVPVYFLAFPFGHIALLAIGKIKLWLYLNHGADPSILSEALWLWSFTVVLGYVQWFIVLPWLTGQCRRWIGVPIPPQQNKK